jgi:hypothetical protein
MRKWLKKIWNRLVSWFRGSGGNNSTSDKLDRDIPTPDKLVGAVVGTCLMAGQAVQNTKALVELPANVGIGHMTLKKAIATAWVPPQQAAKMGAVLKGAALKVTPTLAKVGFVKPILAKVAMASATACGYAVVGCGVFLLAIAGAALIRYAVRGLSNLAESVDSLKEAGKTFKSSVAY